MARCPHQVLDSAGMKLSDFGVIEFHEAFAGQVLANVNALNSQKFYDDFLGGQEKKGAIDFEKFNTMGGSLSIGHPFGATGGRLVTTVANRLIREDKQFGITAACADMDGSTRAGTDGGPWAHWNQLKSIRIP